MDDKKDYVEEDQRIDIKEEPRIDDDFVYYSDDENYMDEPEVVQEVYLDDEIYTCTCGIMYSNANDVIKCDHKIRDIAAMDFGDSDEENFWEYLTVKF